MKVKLKLIILAGMLILICGLTACKETLEPDESHRHIADGWTVTQEQTCSTAEVSQCECIVCGKVFTNETKPKTGECIYDEGTVIQELSCEKPEIMLYKCNMCGKSKRVITKESFGECKVADYTVFQEQTCEQPELSKGTCTVCGKEKVIETKPYTDCNMTELVKVQDCEPCVHYELMERRCLYGCGRNYERVELKSPHANTKEVACDICSDTHLVCVDCGEPYFELNSAEFTPANDGKSFIYTGGNKDLVHVIIPDVYDGLPVTGIGDGAFSECKKMEYLTLSSNIKEIGNHTFYGCTSIKVVELPKGLVSIGDYAFFNCTGIEHLSIPSDVTFIGQSAFKGCRALKTIDLPKSLASVGEYAFSNTGLISVVVADGNNVIPKGMFDGCEDLVTVILPESIIGIRDFAFSRCVSLKNINLPDGVISIGRGAFTQCKSLEKLEIPGGITYIDKERVDCPVIEFKHGTEVVYSDAFSGSETLQKIVLPDTLCEIGERAFADCKNITEIQFKGTVEQWRSIHKGKNWLAEYNSEGELEDRNFIVKCDDGTVNEG